MEHIFEVDYKKLTTGLNEKVVKVLNKHLKGDILKEEF